MSRCVRCNEREAFDTRGVPVNIEVEGIRRASFTEPQLCFECIGEIWQDEETRKRQALPSRIYDTRGVVIG